MALKIYNFLLYWISLASSLVTQFYLKFTSQIYSNFFVGNWIWLESFYKMRMSFLFEIKFSIVFVYTHILNILIIYNYFYFILDYASRLFFLARKKWCNFRPIKIIWFGETEIDICKTLNTKILYTLNFLTLYFSQQPHNWYYQRKILLYCKMPCSLLLLLHHYSHRSISHLLFCHQFQLNCWEEEILKRIRNI